MSEMHGYALGESILGQELYIEGYWQQEWWAIPGMILWAR